MGWHWLPVLGQKGLFLPWSGWEPGWYKLLPPANEAAGGQETGWLFNLASLPFGERVQSPDMRGQMAVRPVPPRTPPRARLRFLPTQLCSQLVPSGASKLVVGH